MNWLITGGCGFIGRNVIAALHRQGAGIRVLDNLSVGTLHSLRAVAPVRRIMTIAAGVRFDPDHIQLVQGDILNVATLKAAARDAHVVVHLAANTGVAPSVEDPLFDCANNVLGTLHCLEAARVQGVARVVFASSGAPLGACTPPVHEEMAPHPMSPYGASKLAGEGYCSAYYHTFGVSTAALRFGNVYGPGSAHKTSVVARFLVRALQGQSLQVFGDGGQTRDFIYISDLVRAVQCAASAADVGGHVFQIASCRETSVNELAQAVNEALIQEGLPAAPIEYQAPRVGDAQRNYADISKARRLLGWSPQIDLVQGLRRTLRWFQAERCRTRVA